MSIRDLDGWENLLAILIQDGVDPSNAWIEAFEIVELAYYKSTHHMDMYTVVNSKTHALVAGGRIWLIKTKYNDGYVILQFGDSVLFSRRYLALEFLRDIYRFGLFYDK